MSDSRRNPPSSRIFRYPLYGPSVAGPQHPDFEYSERSIICNLRDTVSQIVPLIFLNKSFFSGKSLFPPICETLSHKSVDSSRQPNFLFQQLVYSTLGYRTSRVMDVFYSFCKVFKSCSVSLADRRHTLIHLLLPSPQTCVKQRGFFASFCSFEHYKYKLSRGECQ